MSHTCPAKGCTRKVSRDQLACATHWSKLPWRLRTALDHSWRQGDTGTHSSVLSQALAWYATHDCGPASINTDYGISSWDSGPSGDCGGSY